MTRSAGTRTVVDVLRILIGRGRTAADDLAAIDAGASVQMVCVPTAPGARRRRVVIEVSPGADWYGVLGRPPYSVFGVRHPALWRDTKGLVELSGRSANGDWNVWIPDVDVPLVRTVLARLSRPDSAGKRGAVVVDQ